MEERTRWSADPLQRLWASLRKIDAEEHDEAIARLERIFTPPEIDGRYFTTTVIIHHFLQHNVQLFTPV